MSRNYGRRTRPAHPISEIRDAVRAYLRQLPLGGAALRQIRADIAQQLDAGYDLALEGQVYRALNQLAEAGELVREPGRQARQPWYWTRDGWQMEQDRAAAAVADRIRTAARWKNVRIALTAAGYSPVQRRAADPEVSIPLREWERMLAIKLPE